MPRFLSDHNQTREVSTGLMDPTTFPLLSWPPLCIWPFISSTFQPQISIMIKAILFVITRNFTFTERDTHPHPHTHTRASYSFTWQCFLSYCAGILTAITLGVHWDIVPADPRHSLPFRQPSNSISRFFPTVPCLLIHPIPAYSTLRGWSFPLLDRELRAHQKATLLSYSPS